MLKTPVRKDKLFLSDVLDDRTNFNCLNKTPVQKIKFLGILHSTGKTSKTYRQVTFIMS